MPIDANGWRKRAAEYRAISESCGVPDEEQAYQRIALECDRMAARLEELESSKRERSQLTTVDEMVLAGGADAKPGRRAEGSTN